MSENNPFPSKRLSEAELITLLTKASEIDARQAGDVALEEARDIAMQAGISPRAFAAALEELTSRGTTNATSAKPAVRWGFSSTLAGLLVGTAVGVFLSMARLHISTRTPGLFVILGLGMIPAIAIALVISGRDKHRRFHTTNATLWLTTMLLWLSVGGPTTDIDDIYVIGSWLAVVSAALGSMLIAARDVADQVRGIGRHVLSILRRDRAAQDRTTTHDRDFRSTLVAALTIRKADPPVAV